MLSQAGSSDPKQPAEIARLLTERGKAIPILAPKGEVKAKIEKNGETFDLPNGKAPAVLFKLPAYKTPYSITVKGTCNCVGFSKSVFFPIVAVFDETFVETLRVDEDQVKVHDNPWGLKRVYNLEATLDVDEARSSSRYLLVYTRGDLLNTQIDRMSTSSGVVTVSSKVNRSAFGTLELEAKPSNK